jgi:hypothetical protein
MQKVAAMGGFLWLLVADAPALYYNVVRGDHCAVDEVDVCACASPQWNQLQLDYLPLTLLYSLAHKHNQ